VFRDGAIARGVPLRRCLAASLCAIWIGNAALAPALETAQAAKAARKSSAARSPTAGASSIPPAKRWPEGSVQLPFEDLDGVTLLEATATGIQGRDTSGVFVLDTGAGYIALDEPLAIALGITAEPRAGQIDFTDSPLPRLRLGDLDLAQVQSLTFDAGVIRSVIDRPVLGLIGQQPMNDRALWIDYQAKRLALVPVAAEDSSSPAASRRTLASLLPASAIAIPFRMVAGGKVLIEARVVPRQGTPSKWRTFVFDTGATKCAVFVSREDSLDGAARWQPSIHALETPTLLGRSAASLIRAAHVEVRGTRASGDAVLSTGAQRASKPSDHPARMTSARAVAPDVDVLLVDSPLGKELSRVAGEKVSGLLGYSFLRRFRIVCDYPHRILWLDPVVGFRDDRPFEHSHAGIQLERQDGAVRVMSVARPSPAERAGIQPGDEVIEIDRVHAAEASLSDLGRRMEGRPGTLFSLTIRRGEHETSYRLRRQRLL
jgi:hypothetical protein